MLRYIFFYILLDKVSNIRHFMFNTNILSVQKVCEKCMLSYKNKFSLSFFLEKLLF